MLVLVLLSQLVLEEAEELVPGERPAAISIRPMVPRTGGAPNDFGFVAA
jgi:hypothetical protein